MKAKTVNESFDDLYDKRYYRSTSTGWNKYPSEETNINKPNQTAKEFFAKNKPTRNTDWDDAAIDNISYNQEEIEDDIDNIETEIPLPTTSTVKKRGYITYKILKALKDSEPEGLRFRDMQLIAWNISNPNVEFDPIKNRGWWSTNLIYTANYVRQFTGGKPIGRGHMVDLIEKRNGRWFLSDEGEKRLKHYEQIFG